jgi:hypothetical protein
MYNGSRQGGDSQQAFYTPNEQIPCRKRAVLPPSSGTSLCLGVHKEIGFTLPFRLYTRQRE